MKNTTIQNISAKIGKQFWKQITDIRYIDAGEFFKCFLFWQDIVKFKIGRTNAPLIPSPAIFPSWDLYASCVFDSLLYLQLHREKCPLVKRITSY